MNLESEILKEHSKLQSQKIAAWVGNDIDRFEQLMKLFLHGEYCIVQRASWIVTLCSDKYPELVEPWLPKMIKKMQEKGGHVAIKRNMLHILQFIEIPRKLQGVLTNLCFDYLTSLEAPIAVKAFSMTVLANITKEEPDLKNELRIIIEQMLPYSGPGIQSRGKKVLKQLSA